MRSPRFAGQLQDDTDDGGSSGGNAFGYAAAGVSLVALAWMFGVFFTASKVAEGAGKAIKFL